jgi:hypothetical protein
MGKAGFNCEVDWVLLEQVGVPGMEGGFMVVPLGSWGGVL